ncbi:PKD domain-containing protein [bacterium]|nr:MAG: PKD domain-containing protein [bacterium]
MLLALAALSSFPSDVPDSTVNLLLNAKLSGNLEGFGKGLRGKPTDLVYDFRTRDFRTPSRWREYGVGLGSDLGVVPENRPARITAEWPRPVLANHIVLGSAYPNQPQTGTGWKIELRLNGRWTVHEQGVGGWYNGGTYRWSGTEPRRFDAMRVSLFSQDASTPLKSIHFHGEAGVSWTVAKLPNYRAGIVMPEGPVRAGAPTLLKVRVSGGKLRRWKWTFGDGATATGPLIRHRFLRTGDQRITLAVSDGRDEAVYRQTLYVRPVAQVELQTGVVLAGKAAQFGTKVVSGKPDRIDWEFGDGKRASGAQASHTYARPGIYTLRITAKVGPLSNTTTATIRVHTEATKRLPQVILDSDAKNEQDDQFYLGYALFSELDLLGTNSIHHSGGQEPENYSEIKRIFRLARESGLPASRLTPIFRGANAPLKIPESGKWDDTAPIFTAASDAILAAARGASKENPVWIVPVGPGTNIASAFLQARREGFSLKDRIRIVWLGGTNERVIWEFNGDNDPWSIYVLARSGIETWIVTAPVGGRVAVDKRTEGDLFANNPLGRYLKEIAPPENKPLFDPACLSVIVSAHQKLGWVKGFKRVSVAEPSTGYLWKPSDGISDLRLIRDIDARAMQQDLFNTLKGHPTRLR